MKLQDVLKQLEGLGNEKVWARNRRNGAGEEQYGVQLGDIRKVAVRLKKEGGGEGSAEGLAWELWETGNIDARLLAVLLFDVAKLTQGEVERLVRAGTFPQLADWVNAYVVKEHAEKDALRVKWMEDTHPWAARAGWGLTSELIGKGAKGLDLVVLLDRIESEMTGAAPEAQWTMNFCLAGIGIHFAEHRQRAIAIGEKLGMFRDYPVSKGCTSPFAPIWIQEMVRRQKQGK